MVPNKKSQFCQTYFAERIFGTFFEARPQKHKNFEDFNAISAKIKQEPMDDPLATEDLEERKAFVDSTTQTTINYYLLKQATGLLPFQ